MSAYNDPYAISPKEPKYFDESHHVRFVGKVAPEEMCDGSYLEPKDGRCQICRAIMSARRGGLVGPHKMPAWMLERKGMADALQADDPEDLARSSHRS